MILPMVERLESQKRRLGKGDLDGHKMDMYGILQSLGLHFQGAQRSLSSMMILRKLIQKSLIK